MIISKKIGIYNRLISDLSKRFKKVKLGGGQLRIDKHHEKGKLTALERMITF